MVPEPGLAPAFDGDAGAPAAAGEVAGDAAPAAGDAPDVGAGGVMPSG
ncbi:MAG TPA: hypothetical protein VHQ94_04665 [Pyrinomonadaceae bacterium]|nr:hypothetical protein [Pyrinomonadaceae bacterium]